MKFDPCTRENLILASLPDEERYRLARSMEMVDLPVRTLLANSERPIEYVWFPTAGLVSVVTQMEDGSAVETAAIGAEGVVGVPLLLAIETSNTIVFQQVAGSALRMHAADFRAEMGGRSALRDAVTQFTGLLLAQTMQGAACNRLHDATQRCARWLLLCRERLGREDIPMTHDFLAQMLGASRPSVSATMGRLEHGHLVEQSRGHVHIIDVAALEAVACECYGVLCNEYRRFKRRLFGEPA